MTARLLSIRELSTKHDCSLRTLRFYEEIGFLNPRRLDRQRLYNLEDETKLKLIIRGKRLGLSLQEIRRLILEKMEQTAGCSAEMETVVPFLSREMVEHQIALLADRRAAVDVAIAQLQEAQLRLPSADEAVSA